MGFSINFLFIDGEGGIRLFNIMKWCKGRDSLKFNLLVIGDYLIGIVV